jgi:amino acid transporter
MAHPGPSAALPSLTPTRSTLAANRLGTVAVVIFVWSAATPLTVVAGIVTTGYAVTGQLGMSAAFGVNGLVLMLFAVGYTAMAARIGQVGGLYAYLARGLHRLAGWAVRGSRCCRTTRCKRRCTARSAWRRGRCSTAGSAWICRGG